jgi:hypothetical protein
MCQQSKKAAYLSQCQSLRCAFYVLFKNEKWRFAPPILQLLTFAMANHKPQKTNDSYSEREAT